MTLTHVTELTTGRNAVNSAKKMTLDEPLEE